MEINEINSDRVVLQLLGIEKKWVRSSEGEWVDKKTLKKELNENAIAMETESKKWWMFWKSRNKL
ncbi:MAG: hypothetical protein QNL29_05250 [Crocinitomicaceae bacterium]